jgi:hypothetical protein
LSITPHAGRVPGKFYWNMPPDETTHTTRADNTCELLQHETPAPLANEIVNNGTLPVFIGREPLEAWRFLSRLTVTGMCLSRNGPMGVERGD